MKNLKPYPKGTSGFAGRRKNRLSDDLASVKSMTHLEVNKVVSKYARMVRATLKAKLEDPATTIVELAVAKIFEQSINMGDYSKLNFLLDRCIGKVKEEIEEDDESLDAREEIGKLSMNELLTLVKTNLPKEN